MKKKRLIIFDLDGTVLDTIDDLSGAVNHSLEKNGFPKRSREEVMRFVGNGVSKLIERALPEGEKTEENISVVRAGFDEFYSEHYADKTRPYPGIKELLEEIKGRGILLAALSNKPEIFTRDLIERFFPGIFDEIRGNREGIPRKPDPTSELDIMSSLSADKEETLHIGDSETDIMTAKNAGADVIAVSWGYRPIETLEKAGPGAIVSDIKGLREEILKRIN